MLEHWPPTWVANWLPKLGPLYTRRSHGPMFNPNQAFLLVPKVGNQPPRAFTLGVEAEIEKMFSICPKLLINEC